MSALNILGGIGQGIMAGQQHIAQQNQAAAQQRNWDMQNRFNNAQLGALNDEMKTKRAERERIDSLARVYQQYGDKDWTDPATFEAMTKDALPYMSAQEVATLQKQSAAVREAAGVDAVNRYLYANDLSGFQRALEQKQPGARLTNEGGMLRITRPDGTKQDFTDAKGFAALLGQGAALERLQAHETNKKKGDQEWHAGEAKIAADNALALQRNATAAGKTPGHFDAEGRWVPNPAYKGDDKGIDVIGGLEDYTKAFGDDLSGGEWDRPLGYSIFTRLRANNPDIAGTEAGQALMANRSRDLARKNGQLVPMVGRDGQLEIVANIGPDKFVYESGVSEDRLLKTPGLDDKPLASSAEDVGRLYLQAIQTSAAQEPKAFNAAVIAARDPQALAKVQAAAAHGERGAQRILQLVPAVRRAEQYTQSLPLPQGDKRSGSEAPTFTAEEKAAAEKFGVTEQRGIGDYIASAAGAVKDGVGRAISAADKNFVTSTLRKIRSSGQIERGDAVAIAERVRENPALREMFSDDELWAISVAANQRL